MSATRAPTRRRARATAPVVLLAALITLLTGFAAPVAYADGGTVTPSAVRPEGKVTVQSKGWPAYAEVQAVVCGDLAIGGSRTCDLPSAAVERADKQGKVVLQVVVNGPPRPCPCVVRLSTFSSDAPPRNLPVDIIGHRVGTPPEAASPAADLSLTDVRVVSTGLDLRRLMGLGGSAQVVATVTNRGNAPATVPAMTVGLGAGDVEMAPSSAADLTIPAQQSREIVFDVALPLATFGEQQAVVAWADGAGTISTGWTTYPWGLLALLVLLLCLAAAWAWWQLTGKPRASARRRLDLAISSYALPDVVYVEDLGGFLVNPSALRNSRVLGRVEARVSTAELVRLAAGGCVNLAAPPDQVSEPSGAVEEAGQPVR